MDSEQEAAIQALTAALRATGVSTATILELAEDVPRIFNRDPYEEPRLVGIRRACDAEPRLVLIDPPTERRGGRA